MSENLESCGSCGQFKNNHDQCPELTNLFLCFRVKRKPPRPPPLWPASSRRPSSRASRRRLINQLIRDEGIRTSKPIRTTHLTNESVLMLKLNVLNISLFLLQNFCIFSRRFILEHKMALLTGSNLTLKAGMGSILIASQFWRHFVQPPDAGKAYPDLLKKVNAKYFRCCA